MRLPRDISGSDLAKRLNQYGYRLTRQTGSHLRLTTELNRFVHPLDTGKPEHLTH